MKRLSLLALVALLLLVACDAPPAGPPAVSERQYLDAAATIAVWSAQQTATAAEATRLENARLEATRVAAGATATMQAELQATSTAVAFQLTVAAGYLQITRDAFVLAEDRRQADINDTLDRIEIAAEAKAIAQEQHARDLELARREALNRLIPGLVVGATILVAGLIVFGAFLVWQRQKPALVIAAPQTQNVALLVRREYMLAGGPPAGATVVDARPLALPAPAAITTPRWDAFTAWRDPWRVPVGVNATGQPIFLDRRTQPHVAILGASGSGKTQSGLWPITSAYLALGMSVLIANARGADFNHFRRHANAHVLPFTYDDGPEQMATLLQALMAELERRDQVLARAGALHWSDLEEGGELALVIDEFTALATRANNDTAAAMWEALQRLTHEARKYGIYAVFTLTDQTQRAIGRAGATVINQCARIAFGVRSPAMARAFIESDDPVGLPPGQFVASVGNGRPVRGAAFHPAPAEVVSYLEARPVSARPLPQLVARALSPAAAQPPALEGDLQAAVDGESLRHADRPALTSLNRVAQFLAGKEGNANADEYRRAARALIYLAEDEGDDWARRLLDASASDVVREEMARWV